MWRFWDGAHPAMRIVVISLVLLLAAACGSTNQSSGVPSATEPTHTGWQLVAIGDSIAQKSCAGCVDFVDRYAQAISKASGVAVHVDNRSATHLSNLPAVQASALRDQLLTDESLRTAIASADIVIVNVGFNDTPWNRLDNPCGAANHEATVVQWNLITDECIARVTNEYRQTLDEIFGLVDQLRGCWMPPGEPTTCTQRGHRDTALRLATVYNDWIGSSGAPADATEPSAKADRAMADAQCWVVESHGGMCVDALTLLNGPSGSSDAAAYLDSGHTHLSDAGAQRIADALAALGVAPLTPPQPASS
jgi:lysophospholipase L1-like esterase